MMNNIRTDGNMIFDAVIIGGGLTGLSTAYFLTQKGIKVLVIEEQDRIGGQISTHRDGRNGKFIFESGPNTGVLSYPEVAELFQSLSPLCTLVTAHEEARKRLIWKGNRFHALPASPKEAIMTPLFRFTDKLRILGEPFRKPGDNPDETVAQLAARRLGKSFVDYAVDPFLSGVYAGNPDSLVTRYALPKLYNLEQKYGSFIKGTIAKAREPKSDRDRLATKKVFSADGGLSNLIEAMADRIGRKNIITSASACSIFPSETNSRQDDICSHSQSESNWLISYTYHGTEYRVAARNLVTTTGSYRLKELLPFADHEIMCDVDNLTYAPVIQVAVGYTDVPLPDFRVFGGLIPSCEKQDILGILNPSACFDGRAPHNGNMLAVFMGGVRHSELLDANDAQIEAIVCQNMKNMLGVNKTPDLIQIFRHRKAIPQYEISTGARYAAIERLENRYNGLYLKGNLCGGIGMADRIHQAYTTSENIAGRLLKV